jgi:hypothetical protein
LGRRRVCSLFLILLIKFFVLFFTFYI